MTSPTKFCLHWTAGSNKPCKTDLQAYHYCIDKYGRIFAGVYEPKDNVNCYDGKYAKHCGGGNTGCIGLAVCGMAEFTESKKYTKYPITRKQIEALCCLNAYLSIKYGIIVDEKSVFTHFEFDSKKRNPEGKIDIAFIPYLPNLSKFSIGNYLRQKINWYREKIKQGKYTFTKKGEYYEFLAKI